MKILMINVLCGIKSTGRICADLAAALEEKGHTVKIAYGRGTVPEGCAHMAHRIGSDTDVYAHGLKARLFDAMGLGSRAATRAFLTWMEDFDPDIIHLHNLHGYYLHLPTLMDSLARSGKKVIWTLHDCWPFTGHSATCDQISCTRWETGCHDCPLKGIYPASLTDRSQRNWQWKKDAFTALPDLTLVTPSRWLAGLAKRSFLGKFPIEVIHNGIDTDVFRPTPGSFREDNGLAGKRVLLGVASDWSDAKGLSDFVALSKKLDDTSRIVLVGLTPRQKEALPQEILGITRTDSPRALAEVYTAADVFVNLTYCDTFPTVNLEALSCGTPVLTYNTGGSPECIDDSGGMVVPRGDLEAVLAALDSCCAKTPAPGSFGKEAFLKDHLNLYQA